MPIDQDHETKIENDVLGMTYEHDIIIECIIDSIAALETDLGSLIRLWGGTGSIIIREVSVRNIRLYRTQCTYVHVRI